ncbi:MAG: TM2 domain-containing protein [Ruminococcus sp.]|nr:TM2 domain-containing protein [Ruminococcus sp.]
MPLLRSTAPQAEEDDTVKVKFKQKTYEFEIPKVMISAGAKEQLQFLRKNRFLVILLCVLGLFGLAGMHRLYVGKYVSGILYFLTAGGFFIGTICDLCALSKGSFKTADGLPLK